MTDWRATLEGNRSAHPDAVGGAPPPSKLPEVLRTALQLTALPFVLIDIAAQRAARLVFRPRYRITGGCKQTGNCCRYIILDNNELTVLGPLIRRVFVWWATEVNGFYERGFRVDVGGDNEARVYSCRYITDDNRCANYRLRPAVCRQWPRVDYFVRPEVRRGCGYRVEDVRPSSSLTAKKKGVSLPIVDDRDAG